MTDAVQALADTGVSIWLDDLNRTILTNGEFKALTTDKGVVGVTSNPTIFATALSQGDAYDEQVKDLAAKGLSVDDAVFEITTTDVANACDQLREIYDRTGGLDGRASIEVDPRLAGDTAGTNEAAKKLWAKIDKPNLMIKIPATKEGLPAIAATLAEGISVNVTLIFSLERYRGVMNAFLEGMEQAKANGHDISQIRSVASFFVSRVDTEIDKRLEQIGTEEAKALAGKAGIANARLAYQAYEEVFSTPRWQSLADAGAHTQRPLWASTGVKNPDYDDTMYVVQLAVKDTVNTMPPKTLDAVIDHGKIDGDQVTGHYADAQQVMDDLDKIGVDYADVVDLLEKEGVEKFEKSWAQLLDSVASELKDKAAVK